MATSVVVIILLDSVADFHLSNETLIDQMNLQSNASYKLQLCEPNVVNFVLNKVSNGNTTKLALKSYDRSNSFLNLMNTSSSHSVIKEDIGDRYITSDLDLYSGESFQNFIDSNDIINENHNIKDVVNTKKEHNLNVTEKTRNSAPFLVAIFETLSNVTAQTCGGTLLSSHWVITGANCVNVLIDLYGNETNSADRSSYTVVAGSTNPLVDGSVHNVSQVLMSDGKLHNHYTIDLKKDPNSAAFLSRVFSRYNFTLALMRINPGVGVGEMKIWLGGARQSLDVTVYGWALLKNDSLDAMLVTSSPAKIVAPRNCLRNSTPALCLAVNDKSVGNTQMDAGGAVFMSTEHQTYLFAVLLDGHAPMLAEPLAEHAYWIERVLSADENYTNL